jgi:hypothetical protein
MFTCAQLQRLTKTAKRFRAHYRKLIASFDINLIIYNLERHLIRLLSTEKSCFGLNIPKIQAEKHVATFHRKLLCVHFVSSNVFQAQKPFEQILIAKTFRETCKGRI